MVVAILAIITFSGLIFSLMSSNLLENLKVRSQAMATIYLTETLENIGIASFESVTQDNSDMFIPEEAKDSKYVINLQIKESNELFNEDSTKENIIKKVIATVSYKVGNKDYQCTMQRIKAK